MGQVERSFQAIDHLVSCVCRTIPCSREAVVHEELDREGCVPLPNNTSSMIGSEQVPTSLHNDMVDRSFSMSILETRYMQFLKPLTQIRDITSGTGRCLVLLDDKLNATSIPIAYIELTIKIEQKAYVLGARLQSAPQSAKGWSFDNSVESSRMVTKRVPKSAYLLRDTTPLLCSSCRWYP